MRSFVRPKRLVGILGVGIVGLNIAAYQQARAFTHFAPTGRRTPSPEKLSVGSGGSDTSIGFDESVDVASAFRYARSLPQAGPVILYGASMGAAAVLKGVADNQLMPAALILECPFDSLITTVRHRFTTMGLPSFPLSELLVFWGGVQSGFNGFGHRPVDAASRIDRPTLLLGGEDDKWVRPEESRAIFQALRGPKAIRLFAGVGHDSYLRRRPDKWRSAVAEFLNGSGWRFAAHGSHS